VPGRKVRASDEALDGDNQRRPVLAGPKPSVFSLALGVLHSEPSGVLVNVLMQFQPPRNYYFQYTS